MHYQLIFIILALFSVYSLSQIVAEWKIPTTKSSNTFLQYENPHVGYKVEYPDNWVKLESNSSVMFYPLMKSNEVIKQPSVYLTISNTSLPNVPISLEAIVEETINNLNSSLANFKLDESKSFLLNNGNNHAHKLVYSYIDSNNTINTMDIGLIANNNLILLSFVSSSDKYNKYLPTIEKMVKSFETFTPDNDIEMIINKLITPVTVNASAQGDDQAKITIVEFADYQCPFCAKFHAETKDFLIQNFVETGKVKFLFKDLIVNDHPNDKESTFAASASYCAAEQGKYWEYNDELYKNSQVETPGWITKDNLKQYANNIKIPDTTKFSECLESSKYNYLVVENDKFAKSIGLSNVPTFLFYNGTTPVAIQGAQPYEAFEQIIAAIE